MKRNKFEIGKMYKLTFYDHSIGMHDKMICSAVGWVVKDDTHHVVITAWIVKTGDDDVKKDNVEPVSILKSTLISSRKYS